MTASKERRQEVLALAREHNFLILEGPSPLLIIATNVCANIGVTLPDDPYYYLYFGSAPRPPSYFSLELEQPDVGRVIRFDSLSKILSSGIRIGFMCGPDALMTVVDMHVRPFIHHCASPHALTSPLIVSRPQ